MACVAGKPITIVVLGGSITCGGNTRVEEEMWSYRVFMWINATYPHVNHTYMNSAKPATPSMVIAGCLDAYVPEDVDLVLLEVRGRLACLQICLCIEGIPFLCSISFGMLDGILWRTQPFTSLGCASRNTHTSLHLMSNSCCSTQ